jgi:hypothetical protein
MSTPEDIKNKVALITGGTKGIGYGIAEVLIAAGMRVVITGRDAESVSDAVNRLTANAPGRAIGRKADVRKMADMENAVEEALDQYGSLDLVVANAGLGHFGGIEDITAEQWHETIDTNLTGVFFTVKASIDPLKKSKGMLVTIASLAGTNFFAGGAAYNASKFGLVGFTQAIMLDLRKHGIRVSTIMPGSVTSHFNGHEPNPKDAWKIQPDDIGKLVLDLIQMHPRTLPSKIEVRPTMPASS